MNFFYSGAQSLFSNQTDIFKSVGGLMSSTQVQNSNLNNLFSEQIINEKDKGRVDCIGLFLKNFTGRDLLNFSYYISQTSDSISVIEVGFVDVDQNKPTLEQIFDSSSLPMFVNFTQSIDEQDPMLIEENFESEKIIGVWIKRTINKVIESDFKKFFGELTPNKEETFDLNFVFN